MTREGLLPDFFAVSIYDGAKADEEKRERDDDPGETKSEATHASPRKAAMGHEAIRRGFAEMSVEIPARPEAENQQMREPKNPAEGETADHVELFVAVVQKSGFDNRGKS